MDSAKKKPGLWSGPYLVFLLSIVFASVTDSTLINVLPVYMQDTVGSNLATGWMITGLTAASMVTRLVCGPLTDKFGRKRLVVIGSSAYALNALAYCFAPNIETVFFLRVLNGITQGIYFPVPPMLVADLVPEERLVDGMGFFGVASSVSFAIAPTISLSVYKNLGTTALFGWITVTAMISAVLTMLIQVKALEKASGLENQPKQERSRFGLHTLFDGSVLGLGVVSLLLALGTAAVSNFTVAYGLSKGIENIGLFTLTTSLTGLFTKVLVGRLTGRFTKGGLVAAGCVLSGLATVILGLSVSLEPMLTAAVLYGMGTAVTGQLLQVLVIERVADDRRGVAMSTYSLLGDMGSGAGGLAAGGISQRMGYTACYLLAGAMMGAAGLVQALGGQTTSQGGINPWQSGTKAASDKTCWTRAVRRNLLHAISGWMKRVINQSWKPSCACTAAACWRTCTGNRQRSTAWIICCINRKEKGVRTNHEKRYGP